MSRRYAITLAILWLAGFAAAALVIQVQNIGPRIVLPALAAVLLEVSLYASLAFEEVRCRWRWYWIAAFAPLPYLLFTVPVGLASLNSAAVLMLLAAGAAGWFRLNPRNRIADFVFVALMAAPLIFKLFPLIYPKPHEDLRLDFLGQLMWIRAGVLAVLHDRPQRGVHFGFLPSRQEWITGIRWTAFAVPFVLGTVAATGFAAFTIPTSPWWNVVAIAAGTFIGILWVVALSEEFFFRGLLQQWAGEITRSRWAGLLIASCLFGSAHLGFRAFPNWRFAFVATVAGVFYGLSFEKGQGIRSAMVTHAFMVTIWRTFFR
jgi:membrane protease YdiL (CAAX protease family)